jgi:dimethylamine/trimethylamine dehydrogenase
LQCLYTGAPSVWAADTVVMVTARLPNDALFKHLAARQGDWADAGLRAVTTIGDAHAPSTIASAVCSGHKLGRELDLTVDAPAVHIRREVTALSDDHPSTGPNAEVLTAAPSTGS